MIINHCQFRSVKLILNATVGQWCHIGYFARPVLTELHSVMDTLICMYESSNFLAQLLFLSYLTMVISLWNTPYRPRGQNSHQMAVIQVISPPPSHGSIVFHGNFGCIFDFHDRIRVDIVRNHEAMFRGHCLSSSRSKYSSIDSNFRDKQPTSLMEVSFSFMIILVCFRYL